METKLRTNTLLLLLMVLGSGLIHAQDIHFSQFGNSPLNLNPALTGVHKGNIRFAGNYRNQWHNVPVDYMTFAGSIDMKFPDKDIKNGLFSAGFLFDYDRAGDSKLSWTKFGLSGSYTQMLNQKNLLTAGLQVSINQRAFKTADLRWDNQWNGDVFDAALPSQETFDNTSRWFGDVGLGLNYRFQNPENRNRLNIGAALFHLNKPNTSFYDRDKEELFRRWSLYGLGVFQLANRLDLVLLALGQWQQPHQEIVLGAAGRIHLNQNFSKEVALQLGLSYRLDDAWVPNVELHYRQWLFGVSYDITTSPWKNINNYRGGPEFSVIHIITYPPNPEFKICPIF